MLLAIQMLGFCLIFASLLAGAGWWQLAVQWWRNDAEVTKHSRWMVAITNTGLYIGREQQYAYAYAA